VSLQRNLLELQLVRDLPGAAGVLFGVVLAPGVCEEAFFRGFVLTALAARGAARSAVTGSALLFAALHLNPWQLPALMLFGIFLGLLVYWTHSIYPAVLAHGINNLVSVLGVNVRAHTGVDWLGAGESLPLPVLAAAAVCLGLGVLVLRRHSPVMPLIVRPAPPPEPPSRLWQ
jgi:membrane protease YdiL (CAAX protease family)